MPENAEPRKWKKPLIWGARAVSAIGDWYDGLTALGQVATKILAALPAGEVLTLSPLPLPAAGPDWQSLTLHFVTILLLGLGVLHLAGLLINVVNQLRAPRVFTNLPREHKAHLARMLDDQPWRTSRSTALYVDLQNQGLVRDVVDLASNQAMVRLTAVGAALARDWRKKEKAKNAQRHREAVKARLKQATEKEVEFLKLFSRSSNPMEEGKPETYLEAGVYRAGKRLAGGKILKQVKENDSTFQFRLRRVPAEVIRETSLVDELERTEVSISLGTVKSSTRGGAGFTGSRL